MCVCVLGGERSKSGIDLGLKSTLQAWGGVRNRDREIGTVCIHIVPTHPCKDSTYTHIYMYMYLHRSVFAFSHTTFS